MNDRYINEIIAHLGKCTDTDLLDLILKLLITEG